MWGVAGLVMPASRAARLKALGRTYGAGVLTSGGMQPVRRPWASFYA